MNVKKKTVVKYPFHLALLQTATAPLPNHYACLLQIHYGVQIFLVHLSLTLCAVLLYDHSLSPITLPLLIPFRIAASAVLSQ